jgi:hypothetical protein
MIMWFIGGTVISLLALTGWGALLMLFGLAVNQDVTGQIKAASCGQVKGGQEVGIA